MCDIPRWTIEELVERYELESELRDFFVEGPSDVHLLNWFLRQTADNDFAVYDIDSVEIPDDVLAGMGFASDCKQELVIALAHELIQRSPEIAQATCVADRDFDIVLDRNYSVACLLVTDYTCMEMYTWEDRIVSKFLTLAIFGLPYPVGQVMAEVSEVLQELFVICLANKELGWGMKWPKDPFRHLSFNAGQVAFNAAAFIRSYLMANSRMRAINEFTAQVQSVRARLTDEPRNQMRGHDCTQVLAWYITRCGKGHRMADYQTIVHRQLYTCIELRDLMRTSLFPAIASRASA